jgi:hypothetical protein
MQRGDSHGKLEAWMACRRTVHGPGNMSDRRRADRTELASALAASQPSLQEAARTTNGR